MMIFNNYASMPEMADCTPCSGPDSLNTPVEERIESLIGALFIFFASGVECMPSARSKTPLQD